jgi:hypothetical protein
LDVGNANTITLVLVVVVVVVVENVPASSIHPSIGTHHPAQSRIALESIDDGRWLWI